MADDDIAVEDRGPWRYDPYEVSDQGLTSDASSDGEQTSSEDLQNGKVSLVRSEHQSCISKASERNFLVLHLYEDFAQPATMDRSSRMQRAQC